MLSVKRETQVSGSGGWRSHSLTLLRTFRGRAALGSGTAHLMLRDLTSARTRFDEAVGLRPSCGRTFYNRYTRPPCVVRSPMRFVGDEAFPPCAWTCAMQCFWIVATLA